MENVELDLELDYYVTLPCAPLKRKQWNFWFNHNLLIYFLDDVTIALIMWDAFTVLPHEVVNAFTVTHVTNASVTMVAILL